MTTHTLTMTQTKETTGTVVFTEQPDSANADNPLLKSLYLSKPRLAGARPAKITVTVEY